MIHNLKLRNFKKHSDLDLKFTAGLNGIFGPNYTGKTTILYGILYALGGASHVPGTNIQKMGTNTGLGVEMTFSVGGVEYLVERKKSGAYLQGDGVMLASGTSNVTTKIEELLGMSVKRFRQLKYAEQKQAHALLTLGATELHKIIEELTGIDQINKAMDKLREIISTSAGAMDALSFEDPEKEEDKQILLVGDIEQLDTKIMSGRKRLREENELCGKLSTQQATMSRQKSEWESWNTENASLTSAKNVYQLQVDSLTADYKPLDYEDMAAGEEYAIDIKALGETLATCRETSGAIKVLKKDHARISDQISKTRKIITQCSDDLGEFPSDLQLKMTKAEVHVGNMADKLTEVQSEFSNKTKLHKDSKCPVCQREYEGRDKVEEKELADLEAKVDSTSRSYRADRDKYRDLKRMVELKGQAQEDLARNNAALQELMVELDENDREQNNLSVKSLEDPAEIADKLEALRVVQAKHLAYVNRQVAIKDDLDKAQNCLTQCKRDLKNLVEPEFDRQKMETTTTLLASSKEVRDAVSASLTSAENDLAMKEVALDHCRENLARMMDNNKAHNAAYKRNGTAKTLQKYLRENRDRYSRETWDFFLGSASTFVSDCTNAAITEIQRTENGQFQFVEGEDQVMGLKDASGAQEAIMGLSVQLALAQAAQCPLDILLVDEPTADMDDEHSMAVAAMLSTKGNQVIAISHREMDASLCNNVINMENLI